MHFGRKRVHLRVPLGSEPFRFLGCVRATRFCPFLAVSLVPPPLSPPFPFLPSRPPCAPLSLRVTFFSRAPSPCLLGNLLRLSLPRFFSSSDSGSWLALSPPPPRSQPARQPSSLSFLSEPFLSLRAARLFGAAPGTVFRLPQNSKLEPRSATVLRQHHRPMTPATGAEGERVGGGGTKSWSRRGQNGIRKLGASAIRGRRQRGGRGVMEPKRARANENEAHPRSVCKAERPAPFVPPSPHPVETSSPLPLSLSFLSRPGAAPPVGPTRTPTQRRRLALASVVGKSKAGHNGSTLAWSRREASFGVSAPGARARARARARSRPARPREGPSILRPLGHAGPGPVRRRPARVSLRARSRARPPDAMVLERWMSKALWLPVAWAFTDCVASVQCVRDAECVSLAEAFAEDSRLVLVDKLSPRLYRYKRGSIVTLWYGREAHSQDTGGTADAGIRACGGGGGGGRGREGRSARGRVRD